jgi:hypothetical protein
MNCIGRHVNRRRAGRCAQRQEESPKRSTSAMMPCPWCPCFKYPFAPPSEKNNRRSENISSGFIANRERKINPPSRSRRNFFLACEKSREDRETFSLHGGVIRHVGYGICRSSRTALRFDPSQRRIARSTNRLILQRTTGNLAIRQPRRWASSTSQPTISSRCSRQPAGPQAFICAIREWHWQSAVGLSPNQRRMALCR